MNTQYQDQNNDLINLIEAKNGATCNEYRF